MRSTFTITVLVVVILVSAIFGYRALYPSVPKRVGVVRKVTEGQTMVVSGWNYLSQLRQEGRLPGVATNEHGYATISGRLVSSPPYSLTMRFTVGGETFTNNYTIVQNKKDSPWQLERAWRTDSKAKSFKNGLSSERDAA